MRLFVGSRKPENAEVFPIFRRIITNRATMKTAATTQLLLLFLVINTCLYKVTFKAEMLQM